MKVISHYDGADLRSGGIRVGGRYRPCVGPSRPSFDGFYLNPGTGEKLRGADLERHVADDCRPGA